jgi:succinate dehydrogenase / fumarate reductase membrane anchor subunit
MARGLGSAKEGLEHWKAQRLGAMALVPLSLWFVTAFAPLMDADLAAVRDWLSSPLSLVLLVLFLVAVFHHAALGLQVVVEDYVGGEMTRVVAVAAVKLILAAFGAVAIVSAVLIALAGKGG